jgi:hypothetical protein
MLPDRHLLEDRVWTDFQETLGDLDKKLVAVMAMPAVKSSQTLAIVIDGLMDVRGTFERRLDVLGPADQRHKREALDTLISLGNSFVAARQYTGIGLTEGIIDRERKRELEQVERTVAKLTAIRDKSANVRTLPWISVAAPVDDASRKREWRFGGLLLWEWLDDSDLAALKAAGRLSESGGRTLLAPEHDGPGGDASKVILTAF